MKSHKSVFFSSVVASMSSFTFGMLFTSIGLIIPVLEVDYKKQNLSYEFGTYVSLFATIVFLGAFVSSYFAYLLDRISKDKILLYNNMFYFVGCLILLKFPMVYTGLIARFLIGLGVGITCCTVPGYIFLISNDSNARILYVI
ncbi:glucose transporter type 3 [Nosema bombycis CQ1]|uniref:Glucose transporter type 3 n=1 Tax=Nosema bombycis (strain CQ1 / CVCC 102059) TaxID=578461 RepID=R0KLR1_NOSB1|nr:glucose transporter type 3 [Nosema bombycis CQ1]|eukprot:EOB11571.1 glucose transporter type 3 [Nosema bombycis CQ1]